MSFLTRLSRVGATALRTPAHQLIRQLALETKDFDKMVKDKKVVVFMKGTPAEPRCGFSNAVVQILRMHGVEYDSHNVLISDDIREGIKQYSNWPTIPQIFFKGEFVGGCDILLQMHQSGELVDELKKIGIESQLEGAAGKKE